MRCFQIFVPFVVASLFAGTNPLRSEEPGSIELLPSDPKLSKIVLIAGSNTFKPGEHAGLHSVIERRERMTICLPRAG